MYITSKLRAAAVLLGLKILDITTTLINVRLSPIGWEAEQNPLVTMVIHPIHFMILTSIAYTFLIYYIFDKEKWIVEYSYLINSIAVISNIANLYLSLAFMVPVFYTFVFGAMIVYVVRWDTFILGKPGIVARYKDWSYTYCDQCSSRKVFCGYQKMVCNKCRGNDP